MLYHFIWQNVGKKQGRIAYESKNKNCKTVAQISKIPHRASSEILDTALPKTEITELVLKSIICGKSSRSKISSGFSLSRCKTIYAILLFILGHSTITITANYYLHPDVKQKNSIDTLSKLYNQRLYNFKLVALWWHFYRNQENNQQAKKW